MSVPFCWQDKRALRLIREQIEDAGTATAIYVAFTEIASDAQSNEFTTTHAWLAKMAGACDRTVRRRIEDLKRIGLVEVEPSKGLKVPCRYRLIAIGNNGRTIGHKVRTIGLGKGSSSPTSEESITHSKPVASHRPSDIPLEVLQ